MSSNARAKTLSIRNIRLTALFAPEDIIPHSPLTEQSALIRQMLEHLALRYGIGNVEEVYKEVMDCIAKDNIHLSDELAVPHVRLKNLDTIRIAIATSDLGIHIAGKPTKIIFLILIPTDMPGAYLQTQQAIVKICAKEGAADTIVALKSPLAIWQHFEAGGHRLPDHLQAKHIMSDVGVFLRETDNLSKAIDLFLNHNATELPVIDETGELVGVVTTSQLVRVCMPDYIMWMDDMSPFLYFEPFAEIIRNESSTWLNDIMISDFAKVTEDDPAIQAMKEIGRNQTEYAYVMRGKKLVGKIHLHEFLRCVLR
ncbi:MAG: CBS domain-containing protein [Planctomycetota bacterium]|jgi:CBS domain-containing protein/mannitol/fructose-specific phosphotransferase system IIA component (Ntr-type)|nr:CBS domain-containing protein [Planctomycetota bacterium]